MRLIDADALLAAFNDAKDYVIWDSDDDRNSGIDDCIRVLDAAPTVACERCSHRKFTHDNECWCEEVPVWRPLDFGCSRFEEKK